MQPHHDKVCKPRYWWIFYNLLLCGKIVNGDLFAIAGVRESRDAINVNEFNAEGLFADSSGSQAVCSLRWIMDAGEFVLVQILRQIMYKHGLHKAPCTSTECDVCVVYLGVKYSSRYLQPRLKYCRSWKSLEADKWTAMFI